MANTMDFDLVDKSEYDKKPDTAHAGESTPYDGPERRVAHRRRGHDRRAMVRFELDKTDRRQGKNRRAPKSAWDRDRYDLF